MSCAGERTGARNRIRAELGCREIVPREEGLRPTIRSEGAQRDAVPAPNKKGRWRDSPPAASE